MIFYLLIPLMCVFFSKLINKSKMGIIDYIILFFMIFICGFRYNVGTDYNLYTKMFNHIEGFPRVEILFRSVIDLFNRFNISVEFFFFFIAALTLFIVYFAIKKNSRVPAESLFLFVCLGYFALQFNIMRQMLACAIVLYGTRYLVNRDFKRYLITILISGMIHTTAFILLPFYFISNLKFKRKTLLLFIIIMFGCSFMYVPLMEFITDNVPLYSGYSNINEYTYSKAGVGTYLVLLFNLIFAFIIIMNKYNLVTYGKNNNIFINMFIFSLFFSFLSLSNTIMIRPGYYFSVYMIFLLPDLYRVSKIKKDCKNSVLFVLIFIIYYIFHLIAFNEMLPYNMIFFK